MVGDYQTGTERFRVHLWSGAKRSAAWPAFQLLHSSDTAAIATAFKKPQIERRHRAAACAREGGRCPIRVSPVAIEHRAGADRCPGAVGADGKGAAAAPRTLTAQSYRVRHDHHREFAAQSSISHIVNMATEATFNPAPARRRRRRCLDQDATRDHRDPLQSTGTPHCSSPLPSRASSAPNSLRWLKATAEHIIRRLWG